MSSLILQTWQHEIVLSFRLSEDDIEAPFAQGIDHNAMIEESLETRTHEDKRIQTINLQNVIFADAILKGALSSKKQGQQKEDAA